MSPPIFHNDEAMILCGDQDQSTIDFCLQNNYKQTDMDETITEHMYESRGYDRGFTAGTLHAHELLNKHIEYIKEWRAVLEEEGDDTKRIINCQLQINALEDAKKIIRLGHWDPDNCFNGAYTG